MQKYPLSQSYVGSSGKTFTKIVSMTPYNWQICHQNHVVCGCATLNYTCNGSRAQDHCGTAATLCIVRYHVQATLGLLGREIR